MKSTNELIMTQKETSAAENATQSLKEGLWNGELEMNEIFVSEMNLLLEMKIHNELEMKGGNETSSIICCGNEPNTSRRNETHISAEMKHTSH